MPNNCANLHGRRESDGSNLARRGRMSDQNEQSSNPEQPGLTRRETLKLAAAVAAFGAAMGYRPADSIAQGKTEGKGDAKAEGKADAKSEGKAGAKGEGKAGAKGEGKAGAKGEGKAGAKGEAKGEAKSEGKAGGKAEGKQ